MIRWRTRKTEIYNGSYYDAARAASAVGVIVSAVAGTVGTWRTTTSRWHCRSASELLLVVLADLPHEVAEGFVHVDALFSRCLNKLAAEVLRQITTLVHAHLALILQITFVGHYNDWEGVLVFNTEYLLMECADFLERISRCNRVDKQKALSCSHILLAHSAVLFLASSVQDVKQSNFVVNHALLAVRILNCRVIFIYEMALDELDCQSRLSNTTTADDYELVLPQELCLGHCYCLLTD